MTILIYYKDITFSYDRENIIDRVVCSNYVLGYDMVHAMDRIIKTRFWQKRIIVRLPRIIFC